jgi:hypothetical protein
VWTQNISSITNNIVKTLIMQQNKFLDNEPVSVYKDLIRIISSFSFRLTVQTRSGLYSTSWANNKNIRHTAVQDWIFPHTRCKCHTLKIKIKVRSFLNISFTNLTFLNYAHRSNNIIIILPSFCHFEINMRSYFLWS